MPTPARMTRVLSVPVLAVAAATLVAAPASAGTMQRTGTCATASATATAYFTVSDDGSAHGSLRAAQGTAEGIFADTPAMTVTVRDGRGRLVISKRVTDGSLSLAFARRIGGSGWTGQAVIDNTLSGSCTTQRVRLAI